MLTEAGEWVRLSEARGSAERYCVVGTVRDLGCQRPVQDRVIALGEHSLLRTQFQLLVGSIYMSLLLHSLVSWSVCLFLMPGPYYFDYMLMALSLEV